MKKLLLLILILIAVPFGRGLAATEEAKDKTVTRVEVIEKISAADFFKKKIGDLLSWSVGYDITKINRTNLAPTISYITADPTKVPPDNRTILTLYAKVSDPSGLDNIKGVRADLSAIGRLPNQMLVDNGLWGDKKSNDGIFTIQTSVSKDIPAGTKDIPVAVANKAGWVAVGRTNVDVQSNPLISEEKATPSSVRADGKTEVLLAAKVENPGRQIDIREVTVDLTSIGLESAVKMWDDGTHGDAKAGDMTFSVTVVPKEGTAAGAKTLPVRAVNLFGGSAEGEITLTVE